MSRRSETIYCLKYETLNMRKPYLKGVTSSFVRRPVMDVYHVMGCEVPGPFIPRGAKFRGPSDHVVRRMLLAGRHACRSSPTVKQQLYALRYAQRNVTYTYNGCFTFTASTRNCTRMYATVNLHVTDRNCTTVRNCTQLCTYNREREGDAGPHCPRPWRGHP